MHRYLFIHTCRGFRTGPGTASWESVVVTLKPDPLPPGQCRSTMCGLLPSSFSLTSVGAVREGGRGNSEMVFGWDYSGGKEQRLGRLYWNVLLGCGWEKAGDRALEWETQKEKRLCRLGIPVRHLWPPEATCKAQGGCLFTQLTVSNQARSALEMFRTFRHCRDNLHFCVVSFLYPYIIDQWHCVWFPHEVHCACSAGWLSRN